MKSIEEIINGFESLPELPISEETLGAYIESNLDDITSQHISNIIESDENLLDIFETVQVEDTFGVDSNYILGLNFCDFNVNTENILPSFELIELDSNSDFDSNSEFDSNLQQNIENIMSFGDNSEFGAIPQDITGFEDSNSLVAEGSQSWILDLDDDSLAVDL